ncbi:MAG: hypothetical protein ACI87E_001102 [Mariniblastus sp.]|jgi:hypothetical protein
MTRKKPDLATGTQNQSALLSFFVWDRYDFALQDGIPLVILLKQRPSIHKPLER